MMAPRQVEGSAVRARSDGQGSGSWNAVELTVWASGLNRSRGRRSGDVDGGSFRP
jgi:hypothetical protein